MKRAAVFALALLLAVPATAELCAGWWTWGFQDFQGMPRQDYQLTRQELREAGANCTKIVLFPGEASGHPVRPGINDPALWERLRVEIQANSQAGIRTFLSLNAAGNNLAGWLPANTGEILERMGRAAAGADAVLEFNEPSCDDWTALLKWWPKLREVAARNRLGVAFNLSAGGPCGQLPDLRGVEYLFHYGQDVGDPEPFRANSVDGDHLLRWLNERDGAAQVRRVQAAVPGHRVVMMTTELVQRGQRITLPPYRNYRWPDWRPAFATLGQVAKPKSASVVVVSNPPGPPPARPWVTTEGRLVGIVAAIAAALDRGMTPDQVQEMAGWYGEGSWPVLKEWARAVDGKEERR